MIHQYGWTPYDHKLMMAALLTTRPISTGEWQSMDVTGSKAHMTHELEDVTIVVAGIPDTPEMIQHKIQPDLPWAEDHFLERVSGIPHNPPPSHEIWPYAVNGNKAHTDRAGQFDHTYPERFWPKHAGHPTCPVIYDQDPHSDSFHCDYAQFARGIRFNYGDLSDVVDLIVRKPLTRQAFLPVWFPEDTGAVQGQRVPCTIGYHFMVRDGKLSCRYYIRSCDVMRHLTNDVYLACRLTQWMVDRINQIRVEDMDRGHDSHIHGPHPSTYYDALRVGRLVMHISSLHAFVGDVPKLKRAYQ
jgi:hypothetical protein